MKKLVLFVLLERFADYEYPFLATALQSSIKDMTSPYEVKTISLSKSPVKSIGGITVLPDFDIMDCPTEYAGIILIGGETWRSEEARQILPIIKQAYADGKVIGAICDATVFLGMNGFLNSRKHTSNTLDTLTEAAGDSYTGKDDYQNEQAVRDRNLITANGTAYLELTKEVLTALSAYPDDYIESSYLFFKQGLIEFMKNERG